LPVSNNWNWKQKSFFSQESSVIFVFCYFCHHDIGLKVSWICTQFPVRLC